MNRSLSERFGTGRAIEIFLMASHYMYASYSHETNSDKNTAKKNHCENEHNFSFVYNLSIFIKLVNIVQKLVLVILRDYTQDTSRLISDKSDDIVRSHWRQ